VVAAVSPLNWLLMFAIRHIARRMGELFFERFCLPMR